LDAKVSQAITIMKCDWIQKVSLLIDGELTGEAAREAERHLAACGDCQQAQADFLSLRQQIAAYKIDSDAFAEQRALKRILAAGGGGGAKLEAEQRVAKPRRQRAQFAGVFGLPRLSPVGLAALLLLLVGIAIGVVSLVNVRRAPVEVVTTTTPPPAPDNNANRNANINGQTPPPPRVAKDLTAGRDQQSGGKIIAGDDPKATGESLKGANRNAKGGMRGGANMRRDESAGRKTPRLSSSPKLNQPQFEMPAIVAANNNVEAVDDGSGAFETGDDLLRRDENVTATSKTARHVEQAHLLLRSFRNARPSDAGTRASSDLAYDRRQSKKLLYQNIVLRREAAGRGNLPVESLLDSLEPILIDIANLPDRPAPADVREINERMRRKNLVAMLQISSVESASARNF